MDRLVFGMRVLDITQSGTMIDGKPNLSHKNMALDCAGVDKGKDFWFAKSRMKCIGEMWLHNLDGKRVRGYGTYAFTFVDDQGNPTPMRMADGSDKIVTLAMTHSSQEYVKSVPGKIYEVGQPVYEEGGKGAKGDQTYGNHIHLEIAEGVTTNKYYDKNLGVYRMNRELNPVECFFILDGFTTVKSTHGLSFRQTDSVEVVEDNMKDATKLVEYAKTQIGNSGKKYMDWAGYSDPWCSEFVSYCADRCDFIQDGLMPLAGNCKQAQDFYKKKGKLHKKSEYAPRAGDIVYFGKDGTDHTAIVEIATDTTITVIEGNAGDPDYTKSKVCRTVYHKTDPWLWGYANPLEGEPMKIDLEKQIKSKGSSYVSAGIVDDNGLEIKVPYKSTLKLVTGHNSTPQLNTEWIIRCGGNSAFRIAGTGNMVSVKVKDNRVVSVSTAQGHPNVYIEYLG